MSPVPRFREIAPTEAARREHFACHYSPELYAALGEVTAAALRRDFPALFDSDRARGP